jgi:hypothetical protein
VNGLTVSRQTLEKKKGQKPLICFQVRASQSFRKGTLVLAPGGGSKLKIAKGQELEHSKMDGRIKKLHGAMLSETSLEVFIKKRAPEKRGPFDDVPSQEKQKMRFRILSPLLTETNDETPIENLPPFWAMLRSKSAAHTPNMEMEEMIFGDQGFQSSGIFPKLVKSASASVSMFVARNTCIIDKGDVLTLPWIAAD